MSDWIGPDDIAREFDVTVRAVYGWRRKGIGPRSVKVGKYIRYRRSDVDAWLEEQADATDNRATTGGQS